ncbi:hypothetical protein D3C71_1175580 [compost metagenome]
MKKMMLALPLLLAALFASPLASAEPQETTRATAQECRAYWNISPAASSQRCAAQSIIPVGADGCSVTANCAFNGGWVTSGITVSDKWDLGRVRNCSGYLGFNC